MATLSDAFRGALSVEELTRLQDAIDRLNEESSIETVTTGALSLASRVTLVSVTGTIGYTLVDGTREGQRKEYRVIVAASTPVGTLTPDTFADGTSLSLDAVDETATLEWHAVGGWRVVAITGSTIT